MLWQIIGPYQWAFNNVNKILNDIAQFTYIPRPVMAHECVKSHWVKPAYVAAQFSPVAGKKALDKNGDILTPLTQGRYMDGDDIQAVIQIVAKGSLGDHFL